MWVKLIQGNKYIYLENDYGDKKPKLLDYLKLGWTLTSSNWFNQDYSPLDWLNGKCISGVQGTPPTFTLSKMYYNKIPKSWTGPQDMIPGLPPAPPVPPVPPVPPSQSFNCGGKDGDWKCFDPGDGSGKYSTKSDCQSICKHSKSKNILGLIISVFIILILFIGLIALFIYLYKKNRK